MTTPDSPGTAAAQAGHEADLPAPSSYLAKDYASFRALVLDRLSLTMPQWNEQHVPDGYLALLEILAYVGDHLSYEQDAAATEAYLATARRRISVRRHARLVDYRMSEGCNARVWVCLEVIDDVKLDPASLCFITGPRSTLTPPGVVDPNALLQVTQDYQVFEPISRDPIRLYRARNSMAVQFHRNKDSAALTVDAAGTAESELRCGDVVIFELADADETSAPSNVPPGHPVRIATAPTFAENRVTITWARADRPPPEITGSNRTVVARGNVVLADHGGGNGWLAHLCTGAPLASKAITGAAGSAFVSARLPVRNLTWCAPVPSSLHAGSAAEMLIQDPRAAQAELCVIDLPLRADNASAGSRSTRWEQRLDLLASGPADQHFAVEVDDDGVGWLRFGDGHCGAQPKGETKFGFTCRVGNGAVGNVSAGTICNLVTNDPLAWAVRLIRNPTSAQGGQDREPLDEVRLAAPAQLRSVDERALTAEDYARIASSDPQVMAATARLRWSGTRVVADVHVLPTDARGASLFSSPDLEPRGTAPLDDDVQHRVCNTLARHRRIGHDVRVLPTFYVAIEVGLEIATLRGYDAKAVHRSISEHLAGIVEPKAAASTEVSPFGAVVAESMLLGWLSAVAGVGHARITKLQRRDSAPLARTSSGSSRLPVPLITLTWNEIAVLHPIKIVDLS